MKQKKLLPKHHTGKVVQHHHTSYGALIVVAVLAVFPLAIASQPVVLASNHLDPVTNTESIYAVVQGPRPLTAPSIDNLTNGSTYSINDSVVVAGKCADNTLVKLFKNDVFAGSAFCQSGRYRLLIDLFIGLNSLVARAYNINDVVGPDSLPVVVTKLGPAGTPISNVPTGQQFIVTGELPYTGVNRGDEISVPIIISGGKAPYAISISWGDGQNDLISRDVAGSFVAKHRYSKPGSGPKNSLYITIMGSDQAGVKTFTKLNIIVNGDQQNIAAGIQRGYNLSSAVRISWQALSVILLLIVLFWLVEHRRSLFKGRIAGKT